MTQMEWVLDRLRRNGKVTRNEAIRNGITRLSEYIRVARKELKMPIRGKCSEGCRDYIYILESKEEK